MAVRALLILLAAGFAAGQTFLSREEALTAHFGKDAAIAVTTHWLTAEQRARAGRLAGAEVPAVVHAHVARDAAGRILGTAYFDARTVRTHPQSLMFAVAPDGTLARVSVLAFDEPMEYLPKPKWHESFAGRRLDDELQLKKAIHSVTGATMTARATVAAAREVLAVHQALNEPAPGTRP